MEGCIAKTKDIFQIVCVVRNLEKTMYNWRLYADFDTGSVKWIPGGEGAPSWETLKCLYRGKRVLYKRKAVRFDLGGVDFMLIEPYSKEGGDPYADFLNRHGNGMHHIGLGVENLDEVVARYRELGYLPEVETEFEGSKTVLYDLREQVGAMVKFTEREVGPLGVPEADRKASAWSRSAANGKLRFDLVCQVAVVTRDLDRAVQLMQTLMDGSETVTDVEASEEIAKGNLSPQRYLGKEDTYAYRQKNLFLGGMDIELFGAINEKTPHPINDYLKEHGPGIHHINIRLQDRENGVAFMKKTWGEPLFECYNHGRHCVYFDLRRDLGLVVEIGSRVVGPRAQMPEETLARLI